MGTKKTKNYINRNCSELISLIMVGETMQLLSGKWKMQIITFLLNNGKTRFMDLMRGVEGISPRLLSRELQELLESKMVVRYVTNTKLVTVEYELTEDGKTLKGLLISVANRGTAHLKYLASRE
ncbi:winged helix-turn-helix transcriptional regulator [Chitinophaga filiformis]|uniref:DNA-binding transcriptional regulator, HxlR family n=1 Tax=Chitinophaga filiformis TaxID=104663 RepID=A0A1G8BPF7_CHIFI|nr:helix-turn-helix domain-containing protein [Chitinophaga filiformis]SDH35031.1 DNA-binding transcriptional regulator, HxlR family [Chitinophaga filiformis]